MGSKLIFAYFCSETKVGRRRQNTKRHPSGTDRNTPPRGRQNTRQYTVGHRQKRKSPLVREKRKRKASPGQRDKKEDPLCE